MKVALIDAAGFVGSHILTELLEDGHEVLTLVRDKDRAEGWRPRPGLVDELRHGSYALEVGARSLRPARFRGELPGGGSLAGCGCHLDGVPDRPAW
jgi:hypothetical protein